MTRDEILGALHRLSARLVEGDVRADLFLFGGAVMVLVYRAREGTHDVDAVFEPKQAVYRFAREIAEELSLPEHWLNDAVKGYLSPRGRMTTYVELPNLRISVPDAEYLLAMKALAARPEDRADLELLVRHLRVRSLDQATAIISRYYEPDRVPAAARYLLADALAAPAAGGDAADGTQPDGTQPGGTQPGGTQPGGTQPGGTQPGGTEGAQRDGTP